MYIGISLSGDILTVNNIFMWVTFTVLNFRLIKDLKVLGSKRTTGVRLVFWQEIMNNNVQVCNKAFQGWGDQ